MEIKKFDIVRFEGANYRVRHVDTEYKKLRLVGGLWVPIYNVTLVESIILPELKIGDEVIIHPIPRSERIDYPIGWNEKMSDMANGEIHTIRNYGMIKDSYLIGEFVFAPYHLEKVRGYDMV